MELDISQFGGCQSHVNGFGSSRFMKPPFRVDSKIFHDIPMFSLDQACLEAATAGTAVAMLRAPGTEHDLDLSDLSDLSCVGSWHWLS